MLLFLILAGLISGGAALLILLRAARAGRAGAASDPTLEVYRRQLAEIDDMAERGLLGDDERKAARAEAGRRLLAEAERPDEARPGLSSAAARRLVLAAAIAAPLTALAAYLMTGTPGLRDMPYKARLKSWEMVSRADPSRLALPEMAAVLASDAKSHPKDAQPFYYLGVVERGEGDLPSAIRHLERSVDLDPKDAKVWAALGVTLVEQAQGQLDAASTDAFRRAVALDPVALQPRYFLARADIAAGRVGAGLSVWRQLLAGLPPSDPRRAARIGGRKAGQELAPDGKTGAHPPGGDVRARQEIARLQGHGIERHGAAESVRGGGVQLSLGLLDQGDAESGPDLGVLRIEVDRSFQMPDRRRQVALAPLDHPQIVERLGILGMGLGVRGQHRRHFGQGEARGIGARDHLPALQPRLVGHVPKARRSGHQIGGERCQRRGDGGGEHQTAGGGGRQPGPRLVRPLGLGQQPAPRLGAGGLALVIAEQPPLGHVVDLGQLAAIDLERRVGRGAGPPRARGAQQDEQGGPSGDQPGQDQKQQHRGCVSA